ncbi:hypothetical protein OAU50_03230 [Planctomycetota bacterium]|nr:hypothetical protein [Planctomycetota bacterium]
MNAGGEAAPWDGGAQKQTTQIDNFQLPPDNKLPVIYQPDSSDFAASAGRTVAQPDQAPRKAEPSGNKIFIGVATGEVIGIGLAIFAFAVMPAELNPLPTILGVIGILIALVANVALISELPRMAMYTKSSFIPGVLVYGSAERFKDVLGAGGIIGMQSRPVMPLGEGGVSKLMKRQSPLPCPHEMVGLHVNRGRGPEIIPVDWDAVREFVRGDIVWFSMKGPQKFIFFHKLYPYCPNVRADRVTRDGIFTTLRVGGIQQLALPKSTAMGQTKAFNVNADGQIMTGNQPDAAPTNGDAGTVGIGGHLGGGISEDSFQQPDSTDTDFRMADPDQGFGHFDQDIGTDDRQS